jgi:ketosteroid isomerase-like protein
VASCNSSAIEKEWREIVDAQQEEVKTARQNFLHAFENCDLPAMERFFAPDCVSFDQAGEKGISPIEEEAVRIMTPEEMDQVIARSRSVSLPKGRTDAK